MSVSAMGPVLVSMCREHNRMISRLGYSMATRMTAFQDVYSIDSFLNRCGVACQLHKDKRNEYINAVSIDGVRHMVRGPCFVRGYCRR